MVKYCVGTGVDICDWIICNTIIMNKIKLHLKHTSLCTYIFLVFLLSGSNLKVISDKYSGRSKGFGFVEMDDDNEARAAIEDLDGAEIDGRSCKVNEARPREERPRRDNFRR